VKKPTVGKRLAAAFDVGRGHGCDAGAGRDNGRVAASLARLETAARGDDNMMPLLIEAVEQYVTLGEICKTLRGVWGEQRETMAL
jgi:methylmalonyl-CoA mutase N-terminal domain/subunit